MKNAKEADSSITVRPFAARGKRDSPGCECDFMLSQSGNRNIGHKTRSISCPWKNLLGDWECAVDQDHLPSAMLHAFRFSGALQHGLCRNAQSYDIVVAGAGTGGVSAAIQAARLGANVALLEESDWIGGQMAAAAVSHDGRREQPYSPSGIYREFLTRMESY